MEISRDFSYQKFNHTVIELSAIRIFCCAGHSTGRRSCVLVFVSDVTTPTNIPDPLIRPDPKASQHLFLLIFSSSILHHSSPGPGFTPKIFQMTTKLLVLLLVAAALVSFTEAQWGGGFYGPGPWGGGYGPFGGGYGPFGYRPFWRRPFFGPWGGYGYGVPY
ncbi:hypothetical protein Y032_0004g2007 [Ancylostoma ceylanicum]|uniref:Sulfur globule protein CV3 family protein n=1 Tax=Ancylostoma ceylanicum TaxID=53326 RepID=A0A016VWQ6_9BILA|nr:hypothetical protein Y032_0004g2007 [Ancylostoma ceylanicum]